MTGRVIGYDYPSLRRHQQQQSLIPWDLWNDPWNFDVALPRRIFDQNFGLGLLEDEGCQPQLWRGILTRPRRYRPSRQASGMSEVANTDTEFRVSLDVSHFNPEELSIKTVDNRVIIHGKHEERQDEHGFIQREFRRTYLLPNEVDPATVKSTLSGDGVLAIAAPKKAAQEKLTERVVPIEGTEVEALSASGVAAHASQNQPSS